MGKGDARESVTTTTPLLGSRLTAREDSLALGPEQSHRIIAILEEAVEKLGFLGSIMPDVLQHRDELSKFVGDEISRIIQVGTCLVYCFCGIASSGTSIRICSTCSNAYLAFGSSEIMKGRMGGLFF